MTTYAQSTTMPNRYQEAKCLAKKGYALAENVYVPGLFQVYRPDGSHYVVDTTGAEPACNCPARVRDCKHIIFVTHCLNFLAGRRISTYEQEVAASLFPPSRVPVLPSAQRQTFSLIESAELASAARRGTNIELDF